VTPMSQHEHEVRAFEHNIQIAQEASIPGTQLHHLAFADIVPRAQDGTVTAGQLKAMTYRDSGGSATSTRNKFKVKPTMSDFVIDVHNAARRALTSDEFDYFKQTYFTEFLGIAEMDGDGCIVEQDRTQDGRDKFFAEFLNRFDYEDYASVIEYDRSVRRKVGAALIQFGIHPYRDYVNAGDLDIQTANSRDRKQHAKGSDPNCLLCKRRFVR
jgi:hypothetical protein